ncbi:MAG: YlxR family protein [Oscillospiraceae bacterium]|nr:YlxR family protein [Oscillospiraceae bacterium]MBP1553800.1 YlxR family protein [Oscillospiraceae bacterium]MBQ5312675.1 YlxR family protein [Oscillospiraceae bacterium]MBQ7283853.1 YlxR family protein [Oscillospiraceae bacterium]
MAIRKIPQRKCVGCNTSKDKKELIRVVKNAEGEISVDMTGKKNGRGAYICHDENCLKMAIRAKRLEHAFECQISDEIYERLLQEIKADE